MKLRVHTGEGCQINDGSPSKSLPDVAGDEDRPEIFRVRHKGNRIESEELTDSINHTVHAAEIFTRPTITTVEMK